MTRICYIADFDQDVDDIVAVEYLARLCRLDYVVCAPYPVTANGIRRLETARDETGAAISENIPSDTDVVFCGGALSPLADFLESGGRIEALLMNGGYVGDNLALDVLPKFKGKNFVRTYNFNCNAFAADRVLRSSVSEIGSIVLIGKNVCHSPLNTRSGIWRENLNDEMLNKYEVSEYKRLHDVLACHEGLSIMGLLQDDPYCSYEDVRPVTENGLDGNLTRWGSVPKNAESPYRVVTAAVGWVRQA